MRNWHSVMLNSQASKEINFPQTCDERKNDTGHVILYRTWLQVSNSLSEGNNFRILETDSSGGRPPSWIQSSSSTMFILEFGIGRAREQI